LDESEVVAARELGTAAELELFVTQAATNTNPVSMRLEGDGLALRSISWNETTSTPPDLSIRLARSPNRNPGQSAAPDETLRKPLRCGKGATVRDVQSPSAEVVNSGGLGCPSGHLWAQGGSQGRSEPVRASPSGGGVRDSEIETRNIST
jgi:hypothetical protein